MHLQRAVLGGLSSVGGEAAGTKQAAKPIVVQAHVMVLIFFILN